MNTLKENFQIVENETVVSFMTNEGKKKYMKAFVKERRRVEDII